ncbi:hypothetical protein [Photobacterium rosenbergii]|uniref:Uncharacterized protein n=1 Tax=Photobacterium rosenbergii TaxID=294936 RepID=A0ABU3ZJX5_9GAMM|nr:hypothetical protein [Photobacterium rosenbergii]MDV5170402.1 hypothetical protein [Photobacterium rosenbergii]
MKKSIIALSVIALVCSMGASADRGGPGSGGGTSNEKWNKFYEVDTKFTEDFEVELLGYIPQKCDASFKAERQLKYHNDATYVDLKELNAQKVGKLSVNCNLPKTTVSVRPKYHIPVFINPNSFDTTGYELSFDRNSGFGNSVNKTEYRNWDFSKDVWIKLNETPKVHGIYKSALVIDVESKFW